MKPIWQLLQKGLLTSGMLQCEMMESTRGGKKEKLKEIKY